MKVSNREFSCLRCLRSQLHLPSLASSFFGSAFIFDVRDETAKVPQLSYDLSGSAFV
jgi:hypothetical protein